MSTLVNLSADDAGVAINLLEQGNFSSALELIDGRLSNQPNNADWLLLRYLALKQMGREADGLVSLISASHIKPEIIPPSDHRLLSDMQIALGDPNGAKKSLEAALESDPLSEEMNRALAQLEFRTGRLDRAIRVYQRLLEARPELKAFDNKKHIRAKIPYFLWQLESLLEYADTESRRISWSFQTKSTEEEEWHHEAIVLAQAGNWRGAWQLLARVLEKRPDASSAYLYATLLSELARVTGNNELANLALQSIESNRQRYKDNVWIGLRYACCLWISAPDRIDEIEKAFQGALELDSGNLETCDQYWRFLYRIGRVEDALRLFSRFRMLLEEQVKQHPLSKFNVRFATEEVLWCIGHLAQTPDYLLKAQALGEVPQFHTVIPAPEALIANPALLECWKEHFTVITDPLVLRELRGIRRALRIPMSSGRDLQDGWTLPNIALSHTQARWEQKGLGPLLKLPDKLKNRGSEVLRSWGIAEGDWFVALHVRGAGYKGEPQGSVFDRMRNAGASNYLLAAEEIVRRGGWVIQMGEPEGARIGLAERIVHYAHSEWKSDWMDIFLATQCRCFLGGASGLVGVPQAAHVPLAATDFPPVTPNLFNGCDIFSPKLLYSKRQNRLLTFKEIASPPYLLAEEIDVFARNEIEFVNNSSEEVRDTLIECLDRIEGRVIYTAEDELLQARFWSHYKPQFGTPTCRVSREFLKRHADLL